MDPTWPEATVVAVSAGRIVSVGSSVEDMRPWIQRDHELTRGANVRIDDQTFGDKILLPGFIEPHIHPLIGGVALSLPSVAYHDTPSPHGADIPGCKSRAAVLRKLREAEAELAGSEEDLLAWGWDRIPRLAGIAC